MIHLTFPCVDVFAPTRLVVHAEASAPATPLAGSVYLGDLGHTMSPGHPEDDLFSP